MVKSKVVCLKNHRDEHNYIKHQALVINMKSKILFKMKYLFHLIQARVCVSQLIVSDLEKNDRLAQELF